MTHSLFVFFSLIILVAYPPSIMGNTQKNYEYQTRTTILTNKSYINRLLKDIGQARNIIYISMFLFKTTNNPKNPVNLLIKALADARKRGVQIKVLLEKSGFNDGLNKTNRVVAQKLRKQNINVCFDSEKIQTHTKAIIIDNHLTYIGSHNLSASALNWNNEISVLIKSKPFAKKVIDTLSKIKGNRCF